MTTTVNFMATVELDITPDELTELKRLSTKLNKPIGDVARECMMSSCRFKLTEFQDELYQHMVATDVPADAT